MCDIIIKYKGVKMKDNNRVALYIDAENISPKHVDKLIEEASNYGDVIIKRAFADWSQSTVASWKQYLSKYSITADQQFAPVKGKNSSDISLIISAMVALFERGVDVFCLASSDSDFTRLVQEIRERGKTVVGFGADHTVQEFVNAFSEFIYLHSATAESDSSASGKTSSKKKSEAFLSKARQSALFEIIDRLIEAYGKAYYSQIGNEMKNKYSDFIPKNYGCKSMKDFLSRALDKSQKYSIAVEGNVMSVHHR